MRTEIETNLILSPQNTSKYSKSSYLSNKSSPRLHIDRVLKDLTLSNRKLIYSPKSSKISKLQSGGNSEY